MKKMILRGGVRLGDAVVACVLLLAVLLSFFMTVFRPDVPGDTVVIMAEAGQAQYPLNTDRAFTVHSAGVSMTVVIEDGTVSVTETDCPTGVCAATGAISSVGESIACVPGRVLIKIIGNGEDQADGESADIVLP